MPRQQKKWNLRCDHTDHTVQSADVAGTTEAFASRRILASQRRGFLVYKEQIQDNTYLPCDISKLFSDCISPPPPCFSLPLSSSGLIRVGLWRECEMVTVTTAENDGQNGRDLWYVCADVYVCDYKKLFQSLHYHMCIVRCTSLKMAILCTFRCRIKSWKLTAVQ